MAKIHNQKLLENSVLRCDSLCAGLIERINEINFKKMSTLQDNPEAVMDFIFGKSNENPLQEFTDEINAQTEEYIQVCDAMTASVLSSTRE